MAIKPAVNRRISTLKGYYDILGGLSSKSRQLKENYEKEKARIEEDYTSIGLANPDDVNLDSMKDEYMLAEDKVKEARMRISEAMDAIKKDADKLAKSAEGLKTEEEKLNDIKIEVEKKKENMNKKLASKKRRLASLDGDEKTNLQEEIDADVKANEEEIESLDSSIRIQERKVKNLRDTKESYDAYRAEYNKYAAEPLPDLDEKDKAAPGEDLGESNDNPEANDDTKSKGDEEKAEDETKTHSVTGGVNFGNQPKEPEIFKIETKKDFEKAYKELKDGTLPREKRNVLYALLEKENSFEEFGITTGIIFNKGKLILKEQGKDLKGDIESFMKDSGKFSDDIFIDVKKDVRNANKNILSTNDLKKFGQVKQLEKNELYIEEYIRNIEQYKESGAEMTSEQERMYSDAIFLKGKLESYKEAVANYGKVKEERKGDIVSKFFVLEDTPRLEEGTSENPVIEEERPDFTTTLGELNEKVEDVLEADQKNLTGEDAGEREPDTDTRSM